MKQPTVISINPGTKTVGAIKEEARKYDELSSRIRSTIAGAPCIKDTLNTFTGINRKKSRAVSGRLAFLRIIAGGFALTAAILLQSAVPTWAFICTLALGVSLILGFMTRLTTLATTIILGYLSYLGEVELVPGVALAFSSLIICIVGPGIFSLDQIIRRSLFKANRNRSDNRHKKYSTTYQAYIRL